jgi:hypothetical protein
MRPGTRSVVASSPAERPFDDREDVAQLERLRDHRQRGLSTGCLDQLVRRLGIHRDGSEIGRQRERLGDGLGQRPLLETVAAEAVQVDGDSPGRRDPREVEQAGSDPVRRRDLALDDGEVPGDPLVVGPDRRSLSARG